MHQKRNHCTKSLVYMYVSDFDTVVWMTFAQCSYFETGFGKTLRFIIHKYAKFLLYFMKGCLLLHLHVTCFYVWFWSQMPWYVHVNSLVQVPQHIIRVNININFLIWSSLRNKTLYYREKKLYHEIQIDLYCYLRVFHFLHYWWEAHCM
jgi:hypothetical protein